MLGIEPRISTLRVSQSLTTPSRIPENLESSPSIRNLIVQPAFHTKMIYVSLWTYETLLAAIAGAFDLALPVQPVRHLRGEPDRPKRH